MGNNAFTGVGKNPDGRDLPLGFGFRLQESPSALRTFSSLNESQRNQVLNYVQGGNTGDDAKNRIANAVNCLSKGQVSFF